MTIYKDYNCMVNKTYRIIFNLIIPIALGIISSVITFITQSELFYLFFFLMLILIIKLMLKVEF